MAPPVEVGGISKAMPGCEKPVPQWAPINTGPAGEQLQKTVTTITLKVFGGIKEKHRKFALHASKQALVYVVKTHSGLLNREVPTANDIVVDYARRLSVDDLDTAEPPNYSYNLRHSRRMVDGCSDNDTAFEVEATKANVFFKTCTAALQAEPAMCTEATMQAAVNAGCQMTCTLCPQLTTSTTTAGPTMAPDVQALPTMSFAFKITGHTDWSAARIMGRLPLVRSDPIPYLQRLFVELENAGVPVTDIPSRLWVSIVSGPTQVVIAEEEAKEAKDGAFGTTSILIVVLGGAIGGSCFIGLIFVCVGYCCSRRNRSRQVAPAPVKEVTQVSEGGYRLKKTQVEEEVEPEPDLDCLERCCVRCYAKCLLRCYKRCCTKKLKKAKAWSENVEANVAADPSELTIGTFVKLFGLSSAQYNGLTGTILSAANEKGRYEVDLLVVNDYSMEERQTLSFKPSNMRVIPPPDDPSEVASPGPSPVAKPEPNPSNGLKGSYRSGK